MYNFANAHLEKHLEKSDTAESTPKDKVYLLRYETEMLTKIL